MLTVPHGIVENVTVNNMAKWQPSKSDMSPRKGYIPEIELDTVIVCRRCKDEVSFTGVSDGYYAWCNYHGEDLYEFETEKVNSND